MSVRRRVCTKCRGKVGVRTDSAPREVNGGFIGVMIPVDIFHGEDFQQSRTGRNPVVPLKLGWCGETWSQETASYGLGVGSVEVSVFGTRPGDKTLLSQLCPWTQGHLPVGARGHVQSVHSRGAYAQLCFSESWAAWTWWPCTVPGFPDVRQPSQCSRELGDEVRRVCLSEWADNNWYII